MVDPEQKNEGQWIQLDTPSGEVDKLAIVIGWDQANNAPIRPLAWRRTYCTIYDKASGIDNTTNRPLTRFDFSQENALLGATFGSDSAEISLIYWVRGQVVIFN